MRVFSKSLKIQKRYLGIEIDHYRSDFEALIRKKGTIIMEIKRLRVLADDIFKTSIIKLKLHERKTYLL